jgi:hypothetical protein
MAVSSEEESTRAQKIAAVAAKALSFDPEAPLQQLLLPNSARPREKQVRVPGPGEYDVAAAHSAATAKRDFLSALSANFQKGRSHLPRTYRGPSPGPSDYDVAVADTQVHSCGAATGAAFVSNTDRMKVKVAGAPGPAWYSPKKQDQVQSFHLNTQAQWVT